MSEAWTGMQASKQDPQNSANKPRLGPNLTRPLFQKWDGIGVDLYAPGSCMSSYKNK
jgi:hypothetical protein